MTTSTGTHKTRGDRTHKLSDEKPTQVQRKENNSSTRSSGTSTQRKVSTNDWMHSPTPPKETTSPKIVKYELQVKPNSNSDSGLSSPSSSIDKTDREILPVPLSEAKPRSHRPKSYHPPKLNDEEPKHRFSYHDNEYHRQNAQINHNPQVYRVDNITYADLDPKAFMIPQNKVLPTRKASSSDSRSTYAEISISKSKLV